MATKIRNVELLTLARSDAGTPVLGHVGVGIDANLIQDFEMGLSRVSSAAQFNLALNTEGATTNTAHYGGIAFTQGASADTVMASIKAVNTSVDGYIDLSFNTRSVSDALLIKADGSVGINASGASWTSSQLRVVASSGNSYAARFTKGTTNYYFADTVLYANCPSALHLLNQSGPLRLGADDNEVMRLTGGKVGIGTGSNTLSHPLEVWHGTPAINLKDTSSSGQFRFQLDGVKATIKNHSTNGDLELLTTGTGNLVLSPAGNVGIGTGSSGPAAKLQVKETLTASGYHDVIVESDTTLGSVLALGYKANGTQATEAVIRAANNLPLVFLTNNSSLERMRITSDGKVGINTGSTTLTELLEVNGNVKATKFIGALEGNADTVTTNANLTGDVTSVGNATSIAAGVIVDADIKSDAAIAYSKLGTIPTWNQDTTGNAATATTLETTRNIVVGKSSAGAGDIDAITQSFNGGANISFDSELNSHLPSNLRATTSSNIADEPSNSAVKIIGSDINTPRLKINRQGLIVGFEEVATSGGGGSGGISALTLNTNGLLYLNSGFTSQTETTSTSTPTLNLYLKAAGLFTALTESTGTMSITIGGTTKTLDLPDASFTQLDLSGTNLQVTVGSTTRTRDLSGLSVASATNATNADNIAVSSENTNATRYLSFVNGTSGDKALKVDAGLIYNPSSNTLTTTTFSGALSGNSTTSSGLLVGSTTYPGVVGSASSLVNANSTVLRDGNGDIFTRYLYAQWIHAPAGTSGGNVASLTGQVSGQKWLYNFSASKVRAFLGNNRFLPTPSGGVYSITVSNASVATSASSASVATRLNTTSNGIVKTTSSNGTLSIGSLSSGDIPDNAADTSGNAATATTASKLSWSGSGRIADLAANANTIVVRGSSGAVNVGALGCTSISASSSITSSTNMQAQKITLTNSSDSLRAKDIRPYGTVTNIGGFPWPTFYGVSGSKIGNHNSSSIGGFDSISGKNIYNFQGSVVSDERIKENISNFNVGLDFVRLLQPKKYTYKASSSPRSHYGVIAQEIEEVISTLSLENPSFINTLDYHDRTDEERENDVKAYDRDQIMWVLFNAVKQLDAEVQDLKKQLEEN